MTERNDAAADPVESGAVETDPVEPGAVEPGAVEPGAVESGAVESTGADLGPDPVDGGTPLPGAVSAPAARRRLAVVAGVLGAVIAAAVAITAVILLSPRPAPEPVFAPGALDGLMGIDYPASLGTLEEAPSPSGFSGTAADVLAHDVATYSRVDPPECAVFAYLEPVGSGDRSATDRVITVADLQAPDGSTVTISARAFGDVPSAVDHVTATAATRGDCAEGYTSPFWEATAVTPADETPDVSGVAVVGWLESGFNQDGEVYQYNAAEFRRGNIVVRATCTLVDAPDTRPCVELWDAVAARLAALPAP